MEKTINIHNICHSIIYLSEATRIFFHKDRISEHIINRKGQCCAIRKNFIKVAQNLKVIRLSL